MNEGIEFARRMLTEYAEFLPFGLALRPNGNVVHVGTDVGMEHPPSRMVIETLIAGFQGSARTGEYKAIALFFDVRIPRPVDKLKVDAVQISLEHASGYYADVFFPYTISDGRVEFGEIFAQRRTAVVFREKGTGEPVE